MNYLVDFDTRSVQCKHEDADVLGEYIFDNKLENAVAIISGPDDLELQMSERELRDMNSKLLGVKFAHDDSTGFMAEQVWELISQDDPVYPGYTTRLGKKLIREAAKDSTNKKSTPVKKTTIRNNPDQMYETGDVTPARMAKAIRNVLNYIEDNLGEASEDELITVLESAGGKTNPMQLLKQYVKNGFIKKV